MDKAHHTGLVLAAAIALLLCGAGGCETSKVTTSDGRPMPPDPHRAPPTPGSARANALAVRFGPKPDDTNGNGYPDLIQVEVFLFARPHPSPLHEEGEFVFTLYPTGQSGSKDAQPIATWRFDAEQVRGRRGASPIFGPSFGFGLSLLDPSASAGVDQLPLSGADLMVVFEPAGGGKPVRAAGVSWIQLGRPYGNG